MRPGRTLRGVVISESTLAAESILTTEPASATEPTPTPPRWPRVSGPRWRAVIATLALTVAVVADLLNTSRRRFDLRVYAGAVRYWADGGALYDYTRPGTRYGFTYPPFTAILMRPMTWFGWPALSAVHALLTAAAVIGVTAWLVRPLARRRGWELWTATAVALCPVVLLTPVRDTMGYGQVNLLLLALVIGDVAWGLRRGRWYAGVGIGLAAAIKLVPGVFIGYLLLTRRYRAAAVSAGTFVSATALTGLVAPGESADFWLRRCREISRVGSPLNSYNQSLFGALTRIWPTLDVSAPWLAACVIVVGVWAYRVRRLPAGCDRIGVALTGIVGCLISPISWIHHLVWVIPALFVAVEAGQRWLCGVSFGVLLLRLNSMWEHGGWFARIMPTNAYVWVCLGLLAWLPSGDRRDRRDRHRDATLSGSWLGAPRRRPTY